MGGDDDVEYEPGPIYIDEDMIEPGPGGPVDPEVFNNPDSPHDEVDPDEGLEAPILRQFGLPGLRGRGWNLRPTTVRSESLT